MSPILSGLIGAVLTAILTVLANRMQKRALRNGQGWRVLRPSWFNLWIVGGCVGLSGFLAYFLLAGGSSRADAEMQNIFAWALMIGLGAATAYFGYVAFGRRIMWKGNEICVRRIFGNVTLRKISDVKRIEKSVLRGEHRLTFRDGSTLWLPAHFRGYDELVARLPKRL